MTHGPFHASRFQAAARGSQRGFRGGIACSQATMQDPWGRLLAARLLCGLDGTKHHRRQRATTPDFHACRASPQDIDDSSYEWIVEGDITACSGEISHPALMGRLRKRIADKRVLALGKAFLKAGILGQDGTLRDSNTGVPQGGILSPCWPTWPCRSWTSTSPRSPAGRAAPKASG